MMPCSLQPRARCACHTHTHKLSFFRSLLISVFRLFFPPPSIQSKKASPLPPSLPRRCRCCCRRRRLLPLPPRRLLPGGLRQVDELVGLPCEFGHAQPPAALDEGGDLRMRMGVYGWTEDTTRWVKTKRHTHTYTHPRLSSPLGDRRTFSISPRSTWMNFPRSSITPVRRPMPSSSCTRLLCVGVGVGVGGWMDVSYARETSWKRGGCSCCARAKPSQAKPRADNRVSPLVFSIAPHTTTTKGTTQRTAWPPWPAGRSTPPGPRSPPPCAPACTTAIPGRAMPWVYEDVLIA